MIYADFKRKQMLQDVISGDSLTQVEGVPPLALLQSRGDNLNQYKIEGNSIQNGTPSPSVPAIVQSVGEEMPSLLPSAYQQVEYLEGTGTQYIQTSYVPHIGDSLEAEYAITGTVSGMHAIYSAGTGSYLFIQYVLGSGSFIKHLATGSATNLKYTLELEKWYKLKIDGLGNINLSGITGKNTPTQELDGANTNLRIFGARAGGNIAKARIKKFYIENNGVATLNLVPCYRKADNVAGMYDTVSNTFYTKSGTGTFLVGNDVLAYKIPISISNKPNVPTEELPSEYQQVEYLQSNGASWINSGVIANNNTGCEVDFQYVNTNQNAYVLGSFVAGTCRFLPVYSVPGKGIMTNAELAFVQTKLGNFDTNRHKVKFNVGERKIYYDGVYKSNVGEIATGTGTAIHIFKRNYDNLSSYIKIYNLKLYDNNVLVRNFIPCYRKKDNSRGLFDVVNNVFYGNSGGATFLVGDNITKTVTNIYLDEPLRKIEDYFDYIDFLNQKVVRNIKEVDLSTKTWSYASGNKFYYSNTADIKKSTNIVAEKYKQTTYNVQISTPANSIRSFANDNRIDCKTEGVGSSDTRPTGLAYYILATPTEESITLPTLPTLNGDCYFNMYTTVSPSNALVKYYKN